MSPEISDTYSLLWRHGPFPEPFLQQNDRFSRKWHQDYLSLVVRQYYLPEGPARLENMAATYLYRICQTLTDMGHGFYELFYIRTLDKKEIDFIITVDHRPIMAVEVKTGDTRLSPTLKNRHKWLPQAPTLGIQIVNNRDVIQKLPENTWIISAERFLSLLD